MVKNILIEIRNNAITLLIISLILLGIYAIIREEPEITKNNSEELSITDEIVVELGENLKKNDLLRQASIKNENIDSDTMIKYIFDSLKIEDFTFKTVKPKKIECIVTNNIKFISNSECHVYIISNEKINELQLKLFNTKRNLNFENLNYKSLECQNDGKNYYCIKNNYTNTFNSYSVLKKAYKKDNKIYIQDYYLYIDLTDKEKCQKYYSEEYCNNINKSAKPENGVIYESIYVLGEFGYYLEESYII